jgi:hypothetical protein
VLLVLAVDTSGRMGANPSVEPANSRPEATAQSPRRCVRFAMVVGWIGRKNEMMVFLLFFEESKTLNIIFIQKYILLK